jgi:hypothetical protein
MAIIFDDGGAKHWSIKEEDEDNRRRQAFFTCLGTQDSWLQTGDIGWNCCEGIRQCLGLSLLYIPCE